VVAAEREALAIGRVESVAAGDGCCVAEISYPLAAIGDDLPQLLNVLWGNVSLQRDARLVAVDWPPDLVDRFPGPAFGVAGLRALAGVEGRPLTATALKPLGLATRELARLAGECARGGIDLVKDDHGVGDQEWSRFRERVLAVAGEIARANRATGGRDDLRTQSHRPGRRARGAARDAARSGGARGARGALLLGLDSVRALAARSEVALVAHPAFAGSFCGEASGLAPELLFGDLFRLAGADAVVFPNAEGRFPFGYEECRRLAARLGAPLGGLRPSFLMLGGGIDAARLAAWIPRYGADTIWLVGGSLYAQSDLSARPLRACAVADVVDALEGRDDLLVVGDDDDRGLVLACAMSLRMRITASARSLSSGAVGSSARITGGRLTSARAMDTRCCSPPESCDGMARARCPRRAPPAGPGPLPRLGVGLAGQHRQQRDVVGHVEKRDQVRRLEDEADLVAPQGAQVA
jgi:ribulose-bisphosphate carboxylase large chain